MLPIKAQLRHISLCQLLFIYKLSIGSSSQSTSRCGLCVMEYGCKRSLLIIGANLRPAVLFSLLCGSLFNQFLCLDIKNKILHFNGSIVVRIWWLLSALLCASDESRPDQTHATLWPQSVVPSCVRAFSSGSGFKCNNINAVRPVQIFRQHTEKRKETLV